MSVVRVDEIADIVMGQSPPGSSYNEAGDGLPFFQGKAEFGETSPVTRKWCDDPKRIAEAGDILMSVRAPVGPTNVASERCCIGRGLAAVRADATKIDQRFLRYFLRFSESRLARLGQGSTFAAIGRKEIATLTLCLPVLAEQRRIVDLLSRAEGILRLRREAQRKAAELVPAIFLDLFGDPATNPKRWSLRQMQDVCDISYGIADKLDSNITEATGVHIISISNVTIDGELDLSQKRYCSRANKKIASCDLRQGDLLFNWRNGSESHIGKTALWDSSTPATHVSFLLRLRPRDDLVSLYAWVLLNHLRSSGYFVRAARQQINRKFNASELAQLKIPVPPLDLQRQFIAKAEAVRGIATRQTAALATAQATFDALLHQAFAPEG